jgi:type 1 fimbriae regulatory protein FimB/type 1 fimbriae regulatory protein FimE
MAKTHLKLVTPATKKRAVTPRRRPNSEFRSREHLTETEVGKLIEAAKDNRYGHRDATMILVAYRHGLRASEAFGGALSARPARAAWAAQRLLAARW